MKFNYILLDLDGTLTNPVEGITKSINYAMEKMNKPLIPDSMIPRFIGPPLKDGYMQNIGFTEDEAILAVELYRERYAPKGLYENKLIDGAVDMLRRLKEAGCVVALATSKPHDLTVELMRHFEISGYLDFISAADPTPNGRHNKTEIVLHALENLKIDSPEKRAKTVMVGDRFYDIEGAKNNNIPSMAVLCGFGSREEFIKYGANYIAEDLTHACDIILSE